MSGVSGNITNQRFRGLLEIWRRYKKSRSGVIGLAISFVLLMMAAFAGVISPFSPTDISAGDPFVKPGFEYFFGTDDLGRDVFSGIMYGARVSLTVGLLAAFASSFIGLLVGSIAGYFGGWLDDVLMRLTELFMVIPLFVLGLLLITLFGPNLMNLIVVISILSWPQTARLVRAEFFSLKNREYVEAAQSLGVGHLDIIFSEILPNALAPVVVAGSLHVATAILIEAGLSFLGLGDPNHVSWGQMLHWAQPFIRHAPWLAVFPGIAIALAMLGFNLIGDAVNDVMNPRLKDQRQ